MIKKILKYFSLNQPIVITLEFGDGFYIVSVYDQYLKSTLTKDKNEANKFFDEIVEKVNGNNRTKFTVIKEIVVNKKVQ